MDAQSLSFADRAAVITGAAQGLGAAIADRLAALGAAVAIWDRDGAAAMAWADKLRIDGRRAAAVTCDVSDPRSIREALDATEAAFGVPTLVVTAAGIMQVSPFLATTAAEFDREIAVNLTGTFLTIQGCANRMITAGLGGSVVCISSVAGRGPRPDAAAYAASKAGVISVTRSAAVALAPHQITVNAVCPGIVDTEMTRRNARERARQGGLSEQQALTALLDRVPLGRIQTPADVADVVEFLLSPKASYVTGQAINACGGLEFD